MTPEQFRDCRLALRALRRVKRGGPLESDRGQVNASIANLRYALCRALNFPGLPEYLAMMEAKREVRRKHGREQHLRAVYRVALECAERPFEKLVNYAESEVEDARAEYHAARERFIERIGGRG